MMNIKAVLQIKWFKKDFIYILGWFKLILNVSIDGYI